MQEILPSRRGLKKRPYEWTFNKLVHVATTRGLEVSLTYEEFLEFTDVGACHYCTSKITWLPHNVGETNGNAKSNLDRKDNSLGYSKENCVVSCIICNRIKNNYLSYEEMMKLSPVLRTILPQKNWIEKHKKSRFVKGAGG